MKPTQQDIVDLARDAGIPLGSTVVGYTKTEPCVTKELERLVHLALERFGAGGYDWRPADCAPLDGSHFLARTIVGNESVVREAYFSGQRDISGRPIFCVPITKMLCVVHEWTCLPADLQSVRDRALDDAAAICRTYDCSPRMAAAEIEALKGKL